MAGSSTGLRVRVSDGAGFAAATADLLLLIGLVWLLEDGERCWEEVLRLRLPAKFGLAASGEDG